MTTIQYQVKMINKICIVGLLTFIYVLVSGCTDERNHQKSDSKQITDQFQTQEDGYSMRCKLLGIDNLKIGKLSSQIRIWVEFSMTDSGKIIVFKSTDENRWIGQLYQYRCDVDSSNKLILRSKNVSTSNPFSGWNIFLERVKQMGLYNLSDSGRRNNYGLCNEGGVISVEIISNNEYFEYIYPCWDSIEDQTQITKIKDILQYAEEEFNFKIFPINY